MLTDPHKRSFSYLRLSLLPVCNFRCVYCLPNGNPLEALNRKHLTGVEIKRLVEGFANLGITKIRLTGGEPTLRQDLIEIAQSISQTPGIEKVALTTNGYRLAEIAPLLKSAGVDAINVSIDSLIPERFHEITGQDRLRDVLRGLKAAQDCGISKIKVNVVALRGLNDDELGDFIDWSEQEAVDVRFIELMQTRDNAEFFLKRHLDLQFLEAELSQRGFQRIARQSDGGPADNWKKLGSFGSVGLIRPYAKNFCSSCNRLRVTSEGALQLCLFGNGTLPLRHYLQSDGQEENIRAAVLSALKGKEISHFLQEGNYGATRNLATMGG